MTRRYRYQLTESTERSMRIIYGDDWEMDDPPDDDVDPDFDDPDNE